MKEKKDGFGPEQLKRQRPHFTETGKITKELGVGEWR